MPTLAEFIMKETEKLLPQLKVKRVSPRATLPTYATEGSAGLDLYACHDEHISGVETVGYASNVAIVDTGIAIQLPPGYEGQVRPRSGLAAKHGITCLNAPGTIDSDYRGNVKVILINHGAADVHIKRGDRIAQLVVAPVERVAVVEAEQLDETARGEGGLGSTGR
jgi:dUTP pyrophosphatase